MYQCLRRDASDPLASWSIETDPKPGPGPAPSYTPVPASDLQRMQMILQQMTQTADKDDDGFLLRHVMPIMFSGSDGPLMHHQV